MDRDHYECLHHYCDEHDMFLFKGNCYNEADPPVFVQYFRTKNEEDVVEYLRKTYPRILFSTNFVRSDIDEWYLAIDDTKEEKYTVWFDPQCVVASNMVWERTKGGSYHHNGILMDGRSLATFLRVTFCEEDIKYLAKCTRLI